MKVEEVPQDDKYLGRTNLREVCYAVDENGEYCQVLSVGWEPKNEALSLAWESISEEAEAIRHEVLDRRKSPLAYHMEKHLFDTSLLAAYAGFSKRTVKKHLQPGVFACLDDRTLGRYAEVLNISIEELKKV
ncbi:MAG: hypothetical protein LBB90_05585 [Tannerella sp.]|jgi:hypothetical protein|nr:hypothetical protein [Tannerella sp.]